MITRRQPLQRDYPHDFDCSRAELDAWLAEAGRCGVPTMETFAAGLKKDGNAMRAALTMPWSNGQTEGQVNRLKLIKRQMYGHASFGPVLCSNRHLCCIRDEAIAAYSPGHWCFQERVDGRAACYRRAAKQAVGTRGADGPPGAAVIPNAICSDSNVSRVGSTGCGSVCFHDDGG